VEEEHSTQVFVVEAVEGCEDWDIQDLHYPGIVAVEAEAVVVAVAVAVEVVAVGT
jgi:hypothetical protein